MRILLLDIETAPNKGYMWGLWDQNIGLNQIISAGYTLCWSAKWYQEPEVFFDSLHRNDKKAMLQNIWNLLDEADAVIHYNGIRFDIPTLNAEFLQANMPPPSPYKQIDLLRTVKSQLRLPSNKLDYVAKILGVGQKIRTDFNLWVDVMNDVPSAWKDMEEYNIQDTNLLELVYDKLKPWIKNHPNQNLYTNGQHVCPNCGGSHLHKRGVSYTISGTYQRYVCLTCRTWSRDSKKIKESVAIQGAA